MAAIPRSNWLRRVLRSAVSRGEDWPFYLCLALLGGVYVFLIVAMLVADLFFTTPGHLLEALASPQIQYAIKLSLISSSITALLSLWVAVPLGYLLARTNFWGKGVVDTLLDIPIVLPPHHRWPSPRPNPSRCLLLRISRRAPWS